MFHTVYNSFESSAKGRDYLGKHSTHNPYDDYKGSFRDSEFNPDSKIIFAYAKTAQGAVWLEEQFQRVFNVVQDLQFANQAYQTGTKFDRTSVPHSAETVEKIKTSNKETFKNNPEECKRRSEAVSGDNNPSRRFPESEEQKLERLASIKESWKDPSLRGRQADILREIHKRPGEKEKRSAAIKLATNTPQEIERRRIESSGRKWYVNKEGDRKFCKSHPGEGWKLGYFWGT